MSWGRANHIWCASDHPSSTPQFQFSVLQLFFLFFESAVNDSLHLKVFQQQEGIALNLESRKLTNFHGKSNSQLACYYTLLLCIVSLTVIYTRVSILLGSQYLREKIFLSWEPFFFTETVKVSPSCSCSDNPQQTRFPPASASFCLDNAM